MFHLQADWASSDSRPALRGIRALRSSTSVSKVCSVMTCSGKWLNRGFELIACCAEYFNQLYRADHPSAPLYITTFPYSWRQTHLSTAILQHWQKCKQLRGRWRGVTHQGEWISFLHFSRFHRIPGALISLLSALYTNTESAIFNSCVDHALAKVPEGSECYMSCGNMRVSDLDFTDEVTILADTLEMLKVAFEMSNTESEPLV